MKFIYGILLFATGLTLSAQTYSTIALNNFTLSGSKYVATTNITIASGTIVQVTGNFLTPNIGISSPINPATTMSVQYNGGPAAYPSGINYLWANQPILGPCTLTLTAIASNNVSPEAYAVLETWTTNIYSIIALTNFVVNGSKYIATTNITIASGTIVQVTGNFLTPNIGISSPVNPATTMSVQYNGGPTAYPSDINYLWANQPIPGPCTLTLTAVASNNVSTAAYAILQTTH